MYRVWFIVAGLLVLLALCFPFYMYYVIDPATLDAMGPVGDYITGATAPFLNLAGFIMLMLAFLVQKEELQEQRKELGMTRDTLEKQGKTMELQRFENTFFQMLSLHHQIVDALKNGKEEGRIYFTSSYFSIARSHKDWERKLQLPEWDGFDEKEKECLAIDESYGDFYGYHKDKLGHYFRFLYHILKFIDESKGLNFADQKRYAGIVRAQLSSYELILLFYNAMSDNGKGFRRLIKTYDLFQNIDEAAFLGNYDLEIYEEIDTIRVSLMLKLEEKKKKEELENEDLENLF